MTKRNFKATKHPVSAGGVHIDLGAIGQLDDAAAAPYVDLGLLEPVEATAKKADGPKPFDKMNKAELQAAATERGLDIAEGATKKDLIAALNGDATAQTDDG